MTQDNRARQRLTQQRQHEEHIQESILERAEEEVRSASTDNPTQEQAREHLTQQRHHADHLQETMLNRAEAEIEKPD
jgi:hypothetical protein